MTSPDSTRDMALRSVHTANFPAILSELGISLAVSTYQAGKLVLVRADGDTLNTHFREFPKPMGMALNGSRLVLGTSYQICELRNVPAVSAKLDPPGKHDACYLPRRIHVTGDIDIHEMAYAGEELWFVNTRFSCLCTVDDDHSFVPRWRPPFVTAYDLADRCHLNGLAVRDGAVRYVTALGESDAMEGWREHKASGGVLMDIASSEVVCRGLSMPHSPRWYGDRLWVLESGRGTLATVTPGVRGGHTVAELPGFTRGLDFFGPLAFIGLSQVRETAVFSGIPITERVQERTCGVWVVNINSGEVLAFLRFEEAVQEIFAVTVLPNVRFPEVVNNDEELLKTSYVLPDQALAEVAKPAPVPDSDDEQDVERLLKRGNAAYGRRALDRAGEFYRRCLEIEPGHVEARYNLGVVHVETEAWDEARTVLEEVVAAAPEHPDAYNNLGIVSQHQLDLPAAIAHYRKAISLREDFPDAHFNLGMALLQSGALEEGFAEGEWRWRTSRFTPFECPNPRWDGGDLSDRTILVHTEQGVGDAMQFIRYLPLLKERARRTIVVCPTDLTALFGTVTGVDQLRTPGQIGTEEFDVYAPLMSMPHLFGTVLDSVPATVPYLGVPDDRDAGEWRRGGEDDSPALFDGTGDRLRVGIAWAGSPTHRNDHNRSMALRTLFPLLRVPEVSFYSLQKRASEAERAQLAALDVRDLSPHLRDLGDMAAAIDRLDLVVSVDTSVAHLAGALGKPVWVLLCRCPDWRWMLQVEDTPWYPTMRLFRQVREKQWDEVIERVLAALGERMAMPGAGASTAA